MTISEYGSPQGSELQAYIELLARCFAPSGSLDGVTAWCDTLSHEDLRMICEGARPVAALSLVPMGQFFGGCSVPTAGVAGVAVEPDCRGRGLATSIMERFLREIHERGDYPLSTLYPSTFGLYRSVGYERAGSRWLVDQCPYSLDVRRDNAVEMRPVEADDEPLLRAAWSEWARVHTGQLDRGDHLWQLVKTPRAHPQTYACVITGDRGVEGYVRWLQPASHDSAYELLVTDMAALTAAAATRLVSFFASHSGQASHVCWATGPGDPVLSLLPKPRYQLRLSNEWMLRLVDVPAALEARGYPPGVESEVHLAVTDQLLPENGGRWLLRVANGRGQVTRGGDGQLAMDVRALAPLYSGHQSPAQLALSGWIRGAREHLAAAHAIFAGPAPWMTDQF